MKRVMWIEHKVGDGLSFSRFLVRVVSESPSHQGLFPPSFPFYDHRVGDCGLRNLKNGVPEAFLNILRTELLKLFIPSVDAVILGSINSM